MSFLFSQPAPGILPANSVDFSEVETIAANTLLGNNTGSDSVIQELSTANVATMLNLAQYAVGAASSTPTSIPVFSDSSGKVLADASGWRITGSALIPFADGSGDIGGSAIARPGEVWVKNRINLNSLSASSFAGSNGSKDLVSLSSATATSYLDNFGPDLGAGGTKGLVPAPAIGDATRYLRGDGTWAAAGINTAGALDQQVLAYDSGTGLTTWQYAGLGDGSFGTDNIVLGRAKPTGFAGFTVDNIIINSSSTAPLSVFSGAYNILIGSAGKGQTFQNDNIIIGQLPNTVGNAAASVSIGNALYIANSNYAVTIGRAATAYQDAVTIGTFSYSGNTGNVAIGSSATAFGADSISIGRFAAMGSGASNIVIGKSSGKYPSTGADNTIVGTASFTAVTSGSSNTIVGAASATALTTGSSNVLLGKGAGSALTTGNYNTFVGNDAGSQQTTASNSVVVGQSNTIGTTVGLHYVLGNNNTCSGLGSISIGYDANAGTGRFNLTAGISSGTTSNAGEFNIFMGTNCAYGSVSNANSNVCIGYDAARQLSTGNENLILGHGAGYSISSGTYNVALGYYAGSNIGSRTETVSLGRNAGGSNTGSYSVFIGSYSGQNASAGNEFYLGNQNYANNTDEKAKSLMYGQFNATPASQTLTINATTTSTYGLVGNNNGGDYDSYIKGLADDNLLYVDAGNDRVGIGTAAPTTKLEVNGDILASEFRVTNYRLDPTTHAHSQNSAGTHTVNWSASPVELLTVNADTEINLSNPVNGGAYLLQIIQGAGGPYAVTWAAGLTIKWAGGNSTLTSSANAVDIVNLVYISATNTYYAVLGTDFK